MQPIYIDLHIHTSENANNLNTNYDIAELVGQIKKLNGDSPFMISLTDHNTINKSAYLKAQNLDLNLIIGVELHIQNRAEAKSYHCHIYFNAPIEDAVIDSLNEILDELYPNKLPDRNDPNTPDIQKIINSFDTFDFILLPHGSQKHGAFNYSINDGENLDNAINRSIYYNQFDGFTSRSTKGLEATHQYFERLGISEFINLVTCSDNYSPSIYPRSHSGNDDDCLYEVCHLHTFHQSQLWLQMFLCILLSPLPYGFDGAYAMQTDKNPFLILFLVVMLIFLSGI